MNMKRLEISKLMDEYQDDEFFPAGGSTADPEAVKGWVLATAKPAKQRKQTPRKKKLLIAAALAAVLVLLVGAGYPYIQHNLVGGTLSFEQTGDGRTTALVHYGPVIYLENERIFFTQDDGQSVDITDLINEDTPYIHDGSDPETGMTYYIILGGTPEHYGWFEWITVPDPFTPDENIASIAEDNGLVYSYDCEFTAVNDGLPYQVRAGGFSNPDWQMFSDFNEEHDVFNISDFQWLRTAADQLEIPFIDTTVKIVTTIPEK